jgi:hypothetical protein
MTDSKVTIGNTNIVIDGISGWKFLEATEIVGNITEAAPDIFEKMEAFTVKRIQAGEKVYTRASALVAFPDQGLQELSDERWTAMDNEIRLPGPRPTTQEQVAQILPEALKVTRPLVCRLLAVLAVPDGELEKAHGNMDEVNKIVAEWETRLLFEGKLRDLVKVAAMAVEAFKAEATEDPEVRELLGKLPALFTGATEAVQAQAEASTGASSDEGAGEPSEKSPNSTSSSASQTLLDGSPTPSSSANGGESSDVSEPVSTNVT